MPLLLYTVFFLGLLACTAYGIALYRQRIIERPENRLAAALVPVMLYILFWCLVAAVIKTPFEDWHAIRVYPSAALAYGYSLYYGPTDGPILGEYYGPVKAIFLLPAMLASTPTGAIIIGTIISIIFAVLPVLLIHFRETLAGPDNRVLAPMGFCFALAAILALPATSGPTTSVHVDSFAIGLGLMSVVVLNWSENEPGNIQLALSAVLAALATWAKLIEFPIIAAATCWLWVAHCRRAALLYLAYAFAAGVCLGLVFAMAFGNLSDMIFNVFTIVLSQPWRQPRLYQLGSAAKHLLLQSAPFLLIIGSSLIYGMGRRPDFRLFFRTRRYLLPALCGLFLIPTSLVARVKVGGFVNNFFAVYYFVVAASLVLTSAAACQKSDRLRGVASVILIVLSVSFTGVASFQLEGAGNVISRLPENPQQQAYLFALNHPQEAYFPWNPLSTLMADGKAYHVGYSVFDRCIGGYKPSENHIRAYLPARLKYVAQKTQRPEDLDVMAYLPEFKRRIELPELPGWVVFTR